MLMKLQVTRSSPWSCGPPRVVFLTSSLSGAYRLPTIELIDVDLDAWWLFMHVPEASDESRHY